MANHIQKNLKKEVRYNSFDQGNSPNVLKKLNLEEIKLSPETSLETYIGKKLGSKTIAKWIMKTPFFASLYQMIPGLGHMIMFGNIINELKDNKDLTIVLDSPSSGHALTMFESTINFKEIFGGGLLFKDIEKMHEFMFAPNNIKTFIIGLPTQMAITEGLEVISFLEDLNFNNNQFIMNDSYSIILEEVKDQLPSFLFTKVKMEKDLFLEYENNVEVILPHCISDNTYEAVSILTSKISELKI